jgi:cytochrome d ubiquinol oxidase subunit I
VITNLFAWQQFFHTIFAALTLAGFFVMGISAWHIARKQHEEIFQGSFRLGLAVALVFSLLTAFQGHLHGNEVARIQPTKLAAMESHWETRRGAPMYLIQAPNLGGEGNLVEALAVPKLLSFLAYNDPDAEVKGLRDFPPDERPPVAITFISFRIMVGLGVLMPLLCIWAWFRRDKLAETPLLLKILPWAIPLPYLAIQAGWVVAEVGRQPWIVYRLMRTADAVSPVATGQVGFSLFAMVALYTLLGACGIYLMVRFARKGPAH